MRGRSHHAAVGATGLHLAQQLCGRGAACGVGDGVQKTKAGDLVFIPQIDGVNRAERPGLFHLLLADTCNDFGANFERAEQRAAAHAAGCAGEQDGLPCLHVCSLADQLVGGNGDQLIRSGHGQVEPFRHFGKVAPFHDAELGIGLCGEGEDLIAFGEVFHAFTDPADEASQVTPEDARKLHGHAVLHGTRTHFPVNRVHAQSGNVNQDFAWSGFGVCEVFILELAGAAVLMQNAGFHGRITPRRWMPATVVPSQVLCTVARHPPELRERLDPAPPALAFGQLLDRGEAFAQQLLHVGPQDQACGEAIAEQQRQREAYAILEPGERLSVDGECLRKRVIVHEAGEAPLLLRVLKPGFTVAGRRWGDGRARRREAGDEGVMASRKAELPASPNDPAACLDEALGHASGQLHPQNLAHQLHARGKRPDTVQRRMNQNRVAHFNYGAVLTRLHGCIRCVSTLVLCCRWERMRSRDARG